MSFYQKMKDRWGVGGWGVLMILLAFSATGYSVLWIRKPLLDFLLPDDVSGWLYWTVYVVTILPLYQVLLIIWGTIFGQGRFFWGKAKAMNRFLARIFRPRTN